MLRMRNLFPVPKEDCPLGTPTDKRFAIRRKYQRCYRMAMLCEFGKCCAGV